MPEKRVYAVVFGILAGLVCGPFLFAALVLLGAYAGSQLKGPWTGDRGSALAWLVESALLVVVGVPLLLPSVRMPAFVRAAGLTLTFIALGGLAICDVIGLASLTQNLPRTTFTPVPSQPQGPRHTHL